MKIKSARNTPGIPKNVANIINIILHILMALIIPTFEYINEHIALVAIIINIIGETIPADTAASPSTIAPNIDIAEPEKFGILISLSLSTSNIKIIPSASTMAGKGTPALWAAKLVRRVVGIASWLYVVTATYMAGNWVAIKNAKNLISLVNVTFL